MRTGDRKKHNLFGATAEHSQKKRGHTFQQNGLTDDQENRDSGIGITMTRLQVIKPTAEKMENEKKIRHNQARVDHQLDQECAQSFGCFLFHSFHILRFGARLRLGPNVHKVTLHCIMHPLIFSASISLNELKYPENSSEKNPAP